MDIDSRTGIPDVFPWDDNFTTGVPHIDAQHRRLVELVNELALNLALKAGEVELGKVIDALTDYTVYHFNSEEELWMQHMPGDELTASHQASHTDFIAKINRVRERIGKANRLEIADDILSFLTHWLVFHILGSDRHMGHIALGIMQGLPIEQAKQRAMQDMGNNGNIFQDTLLKMYDTLSASTLQLTREMQQRRQVEHRLRLSNKVIENSLEGIFITDENGLIVDANPSFCNGEGTAREQLIGRSIRTLKPSLFCAPDGRDIWAHAVSRGHWCGEAVNLLPDNGNESVWLSLTTVKDEHGRIDHLAGVMTSIAQLIERQRSLELKVNHDHLTGLPNRRLLEDRLNQAVVHHRRSERLLAVCFIDLDGFKQVNDSLGHAAGDELLRVVSDRMSQLLREEDTVARLGGDEFVLLLGELVSSEDILPLVSRIMEGIGQPVVLAGSQAQVTASVGITLFPQDNSSPELLLRHADEAMYAAKQAGKSHYRIWQEPHRARAIASA